MKAPGRPSTVARQHPPRSSFVQAGSFAANQQYGKLVLVVD
jgi:hypothetical protein